MNPKSQNMLLWILKQKINTVLSDHMLSSYLITWSEMNGDALPKNYKGLHWNIQTALTQNTQLYQRMVTMGWPSVNITLQSI